MTALLSSTTSSSPPDAHSECTISAEFATIPMTALRQRGRAILSQLLNPVKILLSEEGYRRDWRGIANLAGLDRQYGVVITSQLDPMEKILQLWVAEAKAGGDSQTANFDNLMKFLGIIDRWDVADDVLEYLVTDAQFFKQTKSQQSRQQTVAIPEDATPIDVKSDSSILTKDDVVRAQQGLPPQQYDAFVLFADEDIDFAAELIDRMEDESPKFNFKLCVKDRDLIGGISFEHEAIMRLIAERCNRLIVIVSQAFLESSANTFFMNFAQALQIEQRRRKIIPCLYENCILPPTLNFYFLLKYQRSGKLFNFWDKLSDSVRNTTAVASRPNRAINPPSLTITEIDSITPTLALPAPNDCIPIKVPRKKNFKADTNLLAPNLNIPKIHAKGEPTMRSAFSMIQLSGTGNKDSLLSNGACDNINCGSMASLPDATKTKSSQSKSKWYKKLHFPSISNSSISEGLKSNDPDSTGKVKTKKKWFKRRVLTS